MDDKLILIMEGYVKLYRYLLYSGLWQKPAEYLKIFIYILLKVNHKDNKFNSINMQRGSNFFNFATEIKYIPKVKLNQVYNFLRWAKKPDVNMITTKDTTRGIILTLNNYKYWQDLDLKELQNVLQADNKSIANDLPNDKQECKNDIITSTLAGEINKKYFYGSNKNVYLSDDNYKQFVFAIVINQKKANQLIDELSEKIVRGDERYKPFNLEFPDAHFSILKSFYITAKNNPAKRKKNKTVSNNKKSCEVTSWEI